MSLPNGIELRFHPSETCFPCWYDGGRSDRPETYNTEHPCFVASGIYRTKNNLEVHCEAYQFYFEHNNAIGLFGISTKSEALGYHRHDVEGIVVTFKNGGEPWQVYFKAHGTGQGSWLNWDACEKNNGALVVYIALGSHATYSSGGTKVRVLGLANDSVSSKGPRLTLGLSDYVVAVRKEFTPGIVIYDTIQLIAHDSIKTHERFLLPFMNDGLKKKARNQKK